MSNAREIISNRSILFAFAFQFCDSVRSAVLSRPKTTVNMVKLTSSSITVNPLSRPGEAEDGTLLAIRSTEFQGVEFDLSAARPAYNHANAPQSPIVFRSHFGPRRIFRHNID